MRVIRFASRFAVAVATVALVYVVGGPNGSAQEGSFSELEQAYLDYSVESRDVPPEDANAFFQRWAKRFGQLLDQIEKPSRIAADVAGELGALQFTLGDAEAARASQKRSLGLAKEIGANDIAISALTDLISTSKGDFNEIAGFSNERLERCEAAIESPGMSDADFASWALSTFQDSLYDDGDIQLKEANANIPPASVRFTTGEQIEGRERELIETAVERYREAAMLGQIHKDSPGSYPIELRWWKCAEAASMIGLNDVAASAYQEVAKMEQAAFSKLEALQRYGRHKFSEGSDEYFAYIKKVMNEPWAKTDSRRGVLLYNLGMSLARAGKYEDSIEAMSESMSDLDSEAAKATAMGLIASNYDGLQQPEMSEQIRMDIVKNYPNTGSGVQAAALLEFAKERDESYVKGKAEDEARKAKLNLAAKTNPSSGLKSATIPPSTPPQVRRPLTGTPVRPGNWFIVINLIAAAVFLIGHYLWRRSRSSRND